MTPVGPFLCEQAASAEGELLAPSLYITPREGRQLDHLQLPGRWSSVIGHA